MIKDMYRKYFQKSYTFLYPLLGFKRTKDPRPLQVYLHWPEEFPDEERKLVCIYQKEDTDQWTNFEKNKFDFSHNRGIYIYGAPGTGKTEFITR